jgi:hypothetical protein
MPSTSDSLLGLKKTFQTLANSEKAASIPIMVSMYQVLTSRTEREVKSIGGSITHAPEYFLIPQVSNKGSIGTAV